MHISTVELRETALNRYLILYCAEYCTGVLKVLSHGAIFSCNLQRNSTLGRCKNGKYMLPSQVANIFLTFQTFVTNLHLLIKSRIASLVAGKIAPCDRALMGNVNKLMRSR